MQRKSKEELSGLMQRYEQVRKEYESKLTIKQELLRRSAEISNSKNETNLLLTSLQDEIDTLNQSLQLSEFELKKAERRLKFDQELGERHFQQSNLIARIVRFSHAHRLLIARRYK